MRGGPGSEPRDTPAVRPAAGGSPVRRSQDDPSGRRAPQDASFKRKPRGGHPGTPTERSAAFKASAHASSAPRADASSPLAQELAVCEVEDEDTTSTMNQQELVGAVAAAANVEPHLAQEALAEEKNDANDAVFLLLKRQEEAELVAVQEGKAGQGAAQPRNTSSAGAVGRAAKPHTAGQLQRRQQQQQQQQQSGKEHNHSQAHEMQRPRASGNPPMAKPKGNPKGKGTGRGT